MKEPSTLFTRCVGHGWRPSAGVFIGLLFTACAWAADVRYDILLDSDADPATGCTVATPRGDFAGADLRISTQVRTDTAGATVTDVSHSACAGGAFGAPQAIDAGGWPVGFGLGVDGTAIVETYAPLALLGQGGPGGQVRAAVVSYSGEDSDAILGIQLALSPPPPTASADVVPIPTLSAPVLALLALAMALLAGRLARRHGVASVLALGFALAGASGLVWAASMMLDGLGSDWAGRQPLARAAKGDAPPNADLVALWFAPDGERAVFRIDADVVPEREDGDPSEPDPSLAFGPIANRSIPAGQPWTLVLAANSSEPDATVRFEKLQGPAAAGLDPEPLLKWTPTASDVGQTHAFTVQASDGTRTASTAFTVTVTAPANQPPVIAPQADAQIGAGGRHERLIEVSDPDGDAVTLALIDGPADAALVGNRLQWPTSASAMGEHFFSLLATDAHGATDGARFALRVVPQARPVAVDDEYTVREGDTLTLTAPGVLGNDIDPLGHALTAEKFSDPDKGTLQVLGADGGFSYKAPNALPPPPPFKMMIERIPDKYTPPYKWAVGDLDGDDKPDIIYNWTNVGKSTIRALRGSDGTQMWEFAQVGDDFASDCLTSFGRSKPVIADIDDDDKPEVVFTVNCKRDHPNVNIQGAEYRIVALDGATGAVRWLSAPLLLSESPLPEGLLFLRQVVLTVTRLSASEPPVILGAQTNEQVGGWCQYMGGKSTDNRCRRVFALDGKTGELVRNWYATAPDQTVSPAPGGWTGYDLPGKNDATSLYEPPVVADLDGDGQIEVLYEGTLWQENGTRAGVLLRHLDGTSDLKNSSRFGVGDLDGDGKAEIVIVHRTPGQWDAQVRAWRPDGTLLWRVPVPHCGILACPVSIADTDGDGVPEVLLAGANQITVLDALGRLRWAKHYPNELGDRPIGCDNRPAVYDLDGDGVPEVILRVTHTLRAWRGDTGAELDALDMPSWSVQTNCTYQSPEPRVVDLHGNGSARIVLAIAYGSGSNGSGMFVIKSANAPWMPVRKRHGAWVDLHGVVDEDGHVNVAGPAPGVKGRPNVFGQQVQQGTRPDLRTRAKTSFTYRTLAGDGAASDAATVAIDIAPRNSPPRFTSTPPSAANTRSPLSFQLTAVDPDPGDTITYSLVHSDQSSSTVSSAGVFHRPSQGGYGPYLNIVRATDSQGAYTDLSFVINYTPNANTSQVPNVEGQTRSHANAAITGAAFRLGTIDDVFDDGVAAGLVISQTPAAGSAQLPGSIIHLTVSKGPEPRPTPSVVGELATSAASLLRAPFSLGSVSHVYNAGVERGRIISQSPTAGAQAVPGAVNVVVSGGSGLTLALNRSFTSADLPITITPAALAPDGSPQALPALSYTITPLATPFAGSLPTVSSGRISFGSATRGAFRITATGGGRSASADFAVGPPALAGEESPVVELVELSQTLQGISDLLQQALDQDEATARARLEEAVGLWRALDRDALRFASPMTIEGGFLPRLSDLQAAGVTPAPQDALNKQLLRESIAPLKALTEGLRQRHTPLTQLDVLAAAFDAKARLVSDIMPSEYGAVLAAPEYALITGHAIPAMMDALMDDVGESLGLAREERERSRSALANVLVTAAIDQTIKKIQPLVDSAQKYAKDILKQAGWGAAVVALAHHAREYLDGQELIAVSSGASMSFRVFGAPWAFIEANGLEWEYTELNSVILVGPDVLDLASPLIDKIKNAWKVGPTGDTSNKYKSMDAVKKDLKALKKGLEEIAAATEGMVENIEKMFQPTDEWPEDCLFSAHPECTQLVYPDGFESVYHYSGPSGGTGLGGLPVPIVFIVRNNVSGQIYISTPVFLPSAKP